MKTEALEIQDSQTIHYVSEEIPLLTKKSIMSFCCFSKTNNGFWSTGEDFAPLSLPILPPHFGQKTTTTKNQNNNNKKTHYAAICLSNSQIKVKLNKVYILVEMLAPLKSMAEFPLISVGSGFHLHL